MSYSQVSQFSYLVKKTNKKTALQSKSYTAVFFFCFFFCFFFVYIKPGYCMIENHCIAIQTKSHFSEIHAICMVLIPIFA